MIEQADDAAVTRRKFLEKCGRFSVATSPMMVGLLSTALTSEAIAASSGIKGNNGWGNGYQNSPGGSGSASGNPGDWSSVGKRK